MTTWTLPGVGERDFGKKAELWRSLLLSRGRCRLENFWRLQVRRKDCPSLVTK
jgi:hypothetical protein